MGCFNKSCVVTGLQITNDDPIIGIKVKKAANSHRYRGVDFDHIGSEWYPIEFPVRGTYDDYGRIEVDGKLYEGDEDNDYDSTRCDDYMFVHAWAYDHVREHSEQETKKYKERMAANGHKDYEQEDWDTIKESFDTMNEPQETPRQQELLKSMCERTIRAVSEKWLQSYFSLENKNYWFKKLYIEDYDKFKANMIRFDDELGFLESNRFELGFQWHPSYISGQCVDYDLRLGLLDKSEKYLRDQMSEYGFDGDE
jgi:hypothetical protein